jgi:tetratricopeptide (TPR) repeat protein
MPTTSILQDASALAGVRVAFAGRLSGMSKRDAQQLIRERGGIAVELGDAHKSAGGAENAPQLIVVGDDLSLALDANLPGLFDEPTTAAIESSRIEILGESQFWQRLGLVDNEDQVRRLYTPAMLAELVSVPVAVVRRWHRRGLIKPVREVRRLPYFDFEEVATARRLAELLAAGMSAASIERKLAELARYVPGVERPLAQLSVIIRGGRLLLRQGDGLVAPGGQFFFDFENPTPGSAVREATDLPTVADRPTISFAESLRQPASRLQPSEMLELASELEDEGDLGAAVEAYRAHASAAGASAPVCFAMGELLYRLGDVPAARERYYMAIELDENYVEARANLGCVLAELGDRELAVAAFEGAITLHSEYADAHFHLARTLDELNRGDEAANHWREFLRLAPESPWATMARARLGLALEADRSR